MVHLQCFAKGNFLTSKYQAASSTAALDIGYSQKALISSPKVLYLLNADEIKGSDIPEDAFVIYQGHHGDTGACYADIVLPGSSYTEKSATYVNTEGRSQLTRSAVSPPEDAREDWKIIRALSQVAGVTLPYDEINDLRFRMSQISPSLVEYDSLVESHSLTKIGLGHLKKSSHKHSDDLLSLPISDFYLTDPISRASRTMAKCSKAFTFGEKPEPEKVFQAT
jgi:NADH dehydrogenase (ubiquinone) Fe-S protein 1